MGKGSDRGRRPGPGRRPSSPADRRREQRARTEAADSASGPARLLLTRLVRGTAIWNVYVATSPQGDSTSRTHLEFEDTSARSQRYSRRAEGPLLHALFNGAPVSRATLQSELEQALVAAGVIEAASAIPAVDGAPSAAPPSDAPAGDTADAPAAETPAPAATAEPAADAVQQSAKPETDAADAAADALDEPEPAAAVESPKRARATRSSKSAKPAATAGTEKPKAARSTRAPRARAAKTDPGTDADTTGTAVEPQSTADGSLSRSG
jgi:hypothetical protein